RAGDRLGPVDFAGHPQRGPLGCRRGSGRLAPGAARGWPAGQWSQRRRGRVGALKVLRLTRRCVSMSMQRRLVLGAVALLALLGARLAWSDDTPRAGKPGEIVFAGKAVHVLAKGSDSLLLAEPQVRALGDRSFLTGKDVEDSFRVWVPVSDIVRI